MNHVIAGVETEGSLHVVTGSKDMSLRLYKVKNLLFFYKPKSCLTHYNIFLISFIMPWTTEVWYISQYGLPKAGRGLQNSSWAYIISSKYRCRPFKWHGNNHSFWSFTSMFIAIFTYCIHVSFWPLLSVPSSVLVPGIAPSSCGLLKDLKKMAMLFHWRREGWILTHLDLKSPS